MKEYEKIIQIRPQYDAFDEIRMEYAQMLKNQLAKGNNGLIKTKYITFSIEAENIQKARPKLERIEADILNNFKALGVAAYPLNGKERLEILYETFNPESPIPFQFEYDQIYQTGLGTKDFIAPTSFVFQSGKYFRMGDRIGAVSYLQILAPELTDKMLADFLDIDKNLIVNLHIQSVDQTRAIKLVKNKVTDINKMKIEEQKKAVRGSPLGYVGSEEGGELINKIQKSKSKVILIDEFEKATVSVYNFFYELLEDGVFTDRHGIKHDLDGYIIIFTSNMSQETYQKKIPDSLKSRFDMVYYFVNVPGQEKQLFIQNSALELIEKLQIHFGKKVSYESITDELEKLIAYDNLRDIKRKVQDIVFCEFFKIR